MEESHPPGLDTPGICCDTPQLRDGVGRRNGFACSGSEKGREDTTEGDVK